MALVIVGAPAAHVCGIHARLHQQIGVGHGELLADAISSGEDAVAGKPGRIAYEEGLISAVIIGVIVGDVLVQCQGLFKIGVIVLKVFVQNVLDLLRKGGDPLGGLLPRHGVHKAAHAVLYGIRAVVAVVDQVDQRGKAFVPELSHDPVVGVFVRAGEGILPGHDRSTRRNQVSHMVLPKTSSM